MAEDIKKAAVLGFVAAVIGSFGGLEIINYAVSGAGNLYVGILLMGLCGAISAISISFQD